jgi:hypothetical protein
VSIGGGTGAHVRARLLFRQLPPYLVRALAQNQPAAEMPQLAPLVGNLETLVMAEDEVDM